MAEVFISYSQKERGRVAPLAGRLAALGIEAWFDREISAGESFGAVIRAKLKEAKAVLVCWSPEAIESQWIDAEADYAREVNTYVPVFIAPCVLMPPFNRIHTDDLSSWDGSANDPTWLKLIDRIAKLLGRDGVAAAARAHAAGDDRALYEFARQYPDEPAARTVWTNAETRHRKEFEGRLEEVQTAARVRSARMSAEASDLDTRLEATVPAFEAWLADERRGIANGAMPDPISLVKRHGSGEERKLREEIFGLQTAFAQSREDLETARADSTHLTEEFAAKSEALERCLAERDALAKDLGAAKTEVEQLSDKLAVANRELACLGNDNDRLSSAEGELRSNKEQLQIAVARASDFSKKLASAKDELQRLRAENDTLKLPQLRLAARERVILDACKGFSHQKFQIKPILKQDKLKNARTSLLIPQDDEVLALLDSTTFGSNKDGVALTARGIYWRNVGDQPSHLPWTELSDCEFRPSGVVTNWVQLKDKLTIRTAEFPEQSFISILETIKSKISSESFPR